MNNDNKEEGFAYLYSQSLEKSRNTDFQCSLCGTIMKELVDNKYNIIYNTPLSIFCANTPNFIWFNTCDICDKKYECYRILEKLQKKYSEIKDNHI